MEVARVIVDVPTTNVNQTYDYLIPERFHGIVKRGMRVVIPFGRRKITGFVVELLEDSKVENLKELHDVLDLEPVLTNELLQLGKWLAEETISLYITTYQAMLPQVLKASYKKEIEKVNTIDHPHLAKFFKNKNKVAYEEVVQGLPSISILKEALNSKQVKLNYVVKTREQKRYETIIVPASEETLQEAFDSLLPQARRQKEIITYFLKHPKPIKQATLYDKLSINRAHLNPLIEKKVLSLKKEEVYRDPYRQPVKQTTKLPLTDEQSRALKEIEKCIDENKHETFLVHGVTGSGKTEIYLQAIERVINRGEEAIVLVPEISLTPQMVERFRGRFGEQVAVLHSGLSIGEKYDEWRKIHRKEVQVVVGARSAIFAPFENLGIIIIDEEHETTYKQEEAPRYHAKDVAIKRGQLNRCPVVLGSATPTLEAYARTTRNVYRLLTLEKRVNDRPLPPVEIVDMRSELQAGNRTMFSRLLVQKINERREKGEQIVLLLNRRGYSNFILCRDCGFVDECPHCDISLTYHKRDHRLKCHYCLYEKPLPNRCPSCESEAIHFFGTGTERVQEALYDAIPGIRVLRMDVDTTRRKGAHERILRQFEQKEADVLLGTQMIAKGLDFKNVTLVGVLAADAMLHLPDFRSAERTFQLLTQVSGRAGRHELTGEVVVQTYTPDHYSIVLASRYDYPAFYHHEMELRRSFRYPPYYYLVRIQLADERRNNVYAKSVQVGNFLRQHLTNKAIVLGPSPAPIPRLKNRYRFQLLIKYRHEPHLLDALHDLSQQFVKERRQGLQMTIDINPYQFM
ncbi:MAG TPA: primosomal protein N' [Pseudogracilibacillus sp.]|nr:primosomal protein N' [Pseudogracilibacillus sp.]